MLDPWNHADVSAAILKPFVSKANHWMVEKRGTFQSDYLFKHLGLNPNMREQFRGHPHFERTQRFCALYVNPAIDPKMECAPRDFLESMLRRVLPQPKNSICRDNCKQGVCSVARIQAAADCAW